MSATVALVVLAVAVAALPLPLLDDQALFLLGARALREGGTLYRDYWDIKPPGIFLHYLAAGSLFGFDAVGIHLFELLWMLVLGLAMWLTLRSALGHGAFIAAALTVGGYYLMADEWWLALLESATWLPLFLMFGALTAARRRARPAGWLFLAGAMGGVVAVFKPFLGPIPAALVLVYLAEEGRWRRSPSTLALLAAGLATPVLALAGWFAKRDAAGVLWETLWVIPGQIAGHTDVLARLDVLAVGVAWFLARAGGLVVLGAIGAVLWWMEPRGAERAPAQVERDWVRRAALAWVAGGAVAVLAQVQSWWDYHWLLLVPALAMLGADALRGLGAMRAAGGTPSRRALAAWFAVGLAAAPLAVRLVRRAPLVAAGWRALDPTEREAFEARASAYVAQQRGAARWLEDAGVPPGPIYVWGSPLIYMYAGRPQASPIQGWNLGLMAPSLYRRLYADLQRSAPAAVFLESGAKEAVVRRDTALAALLAGYTRAAELPPGTWYTRPP